MSAQNISGAHRTRGFTLIELMIAMVLGLIVLGAVAAVFATNSRTYAATESLGRVQENARVAFELISRDIRESTGNACEAGLPVYNVLKGAETRWYYNFGSSLRGYDGATEFADDAFGTTEKKRVAGTQAIELKSSVSNGITIVDHNPTSAQFKVNTTEHGLFPGDIVMACDFGQAAIFQVTNANSGATDTIVHNDGTSVSPGNCSKGLGWSTPVSCTTNGNTYAYGCYRGEFETGACKDNKKWPATIAKLRMTRWYIGNNARGGRSLWQASLRNNGGKLEIQYDEIAEGVDEMKLRYLLRNGTEYVAATPVTAAQWAAGDVVAVSIDLTLRGVDNVGTDGKPLERSLTHTVAIRNRAP
jgi:type IV pilus assembly protein PilW